MADNALGCELLPLRQVLIAELRRRSPYWAERLASAATEGEVREIVCQLFNLSYSLARTEASALHPDDIGQRIQQFMRDNLDKGPTLKCLAKYLGYSEKYCSDLFRRRMGETFFAHLKRLRVEKATRLLVETGASVSEIAELLGFSDSFVFSHFFKKATGCSPRQFRERVQLGQATPRTSRRDHEIKS